MKVFRPFGEQRSPKPRSSESQRKDSWGWGTMARAERIVIFDMPVSKFGSTLEANVRDFASQEGDIESRGGQIKSIKN